MRMLAESWSFEEISQAPLDQLTWYHLLTLQTKLISKEERLKYAALAVQHGWSRNVLVHHIELRTAERIGSAQNNFEITLAPPQSDLVRETLKDPYKLEFLGLSADVRERELEQALVSRLSDFLLELGAGFAFVGKQVHLEVGGEDFYIDLLFYHIKLHCYVVIELKTTDFKPEHLGQLGFYITAVDEQFSWRTGLEPAARPPSRLLRKRFPPGGVRSACRKEAHCASLPAGLGVALHGVLLGGCVFLFGCGGMR